MRKTGSYRLTHRTSERRGVPVIHYPTRPHIVPRGNSWCDQCGSEAGEEDRFCGQCGYRFVSSVQMVGRMLKS